MVTLDTLEQFHSALQRPAGHTDQFPHLVTEAKHSSGVMEMDLEVPLQTGQLPYVISRYNAAVAAVGPYWPSCVTAGPRLRVQPGNRRQSVRSALYLQASELFY